MTKTLSEIVGTIVIELTPLGSEERKRAVHAAMTLLGEEVIKALPARVEQTEHDGAETLPSRVRTWMRQNDLSMGEIQQVFHIDNETVEIIAEIPGKNNKEKVRNAYILTGVSNFLLTGEQRFDDTTARGLCERVGIYDSTNHAKHMKDGNEFTGSRERGWTVTIPGLKVGANLVKGIGKTSRVGNFS
jgi:hypothetical protein